VPTWPQISGNTLLHHLLDGDCLFAAGDDGLAIGNGWDLGADLLQPTPSIGAGSAIAASLPSQMLSPASLGAATSLFAETAALAASADPVSELADQAVLGELAQLGANVTGAGVTIGILSDSFDVHGGYAADIADGALPAGITVLKEGPSSGTDEGQAMAELVHEIAPAANIMFYTAFDGEADFANGILALANAGCNIIVDDVTYLDEPFFQDTGAVTKAVEQVVADGVDYFTSASNEGTNFYQSSFQGIGIALPGVLGTYLADNFGTTAKPNAFESLTIARGATSTIDLQWDQPYGSAANSLGMVLYNSAGQVVAYALRNDVGGNPDQILQFTNTTSGTSFSLAIITDGGNTAPGLFKFIVYGQGTTINDPNAGIGSGSVIGHEMVADANTVGAIGAGNTPAFGGSDQVESFSSVGSGTTLFNASGNRLATPLSDDKVNFLAPDGTATSVFAPFYGTSAAAPVAAGVAALMLQADGALMPAQVSSMLALSAVPASGPAGSTGAGLIQASTAVQLATAADQAASAPVSGLPAPVAAAAQLITVTAADFNSALATLPNDPTSTADFFAAINPASTGLVNDSSSALGAGASTQVLAMLNNGSQIVTSILPDQSTALFG
jgi:hypothetical protein